MNKEIKERIEQIKNGQVPKGYKKTKIGIVPSEWGNISFNSLFEEYSEYTNDMKKYPLYSLTIEDGIVKKTDRYERSYLVKKENSYKLLPIDYYAYNPMNIRFGAVARNKSGKDVMVSGYYDVFTTKEKSDLKFMDSFLISNKMITYYNKVATGSLLEKQRVHFSQFINFELPLPKQKNRKKIAEILSTQDKVIELKEKLIEEKQKQKKYLMQNLLTGKKRLKGFTSEWEKEKLGKFLTQGSKTPVLDTALYKKITVKLNLKGIEFANLNREMADTRPFYIRNKDEIIIGKQNYFNGSVAIITDEFVGCICSNAIMSFSVNNANLYFIYYYIIQHDFRKKYECLANGTGQKELSEKEFLNFEIELPSSEEQKAIAEILTTQDKEIELLQKELEEEKQKKKSLMQLLLTGIVRV